MLKYLPVMYNSPNNKNDMLKTLRTVFGFQTFRPNQEGIIKSILDKQDVFAVMPTGGGKSLCYQLPALLMNGTTIVISPLISLMKDQVDAALENGIPAAFMNSSLSPEEISGVYRKMKHNKIKLLYIAPERFAMQHFLETLKSLPVSFFAIDEAHCVSEWGHDFRPDYLALSVIPKMFPDAPVAAFTATATRRVQDDIISRIGLRSPNVIRASFNRPNLFYEVKSKSRADQQILEFLKEHPGESGIVYRTTRDSVKDTAEFLTSKGIKALPYHAGLGNDERTSNQDAFNRDEISVIVATIAFGMGIDKSNVRFVVHADLPKNIEGYYQETGRAGRDGEPAHCLLLFSRGDIPKIRYFIDQMTDDDERSAAMEKLNQMAGFAAHNVCRRKQLLNFFGEEYPSENCGTCDICSGAVEQIDVTVDAQIAMSAVSRTQQRFGAGHIVDVVTGADTKRVRDLRHNEIKTYGAGRDKDKKHWRSVIDELLAQEALRQDGDKYPVLKLTQKGMDILFGKVRILALKKETVKPKKGFSKDAASEHGYDETLFERLRVVRKTLAEEQQVPPYVVFSDKTLHEMCRFRPVTSFDMRNISGVGDAKLDRYGTFFIHEIQNYLDANPDLSSGGGQSVQRGERPGDRKKGESLEKTFALYQKGLSLGEIAKQRNLARSTIAVHLEHLIRTGYDIDIDRFVKPLKRMELERLFREVGQWALAPVVERSDSAGYEDARLVRAYLLRKNQDMNSNDTSGQENS
jgi:ATP-dependent DNA helicase RecQ